MKQLPGEYTAEMEEHISVAMEVDEVDPVEIFGADALMAPDAAKLADSDFFNSFADDFDDSDIN